MAENKTPKEPTALVNLVSEIPKDKRKEIALEVNEDYDTDISSRSGWAANRDKWYKLWACLRDKKNEPWPDASNVCIPMLAEASNQFHGRALQAFLTSPGVVKVMPVGKLDTGRARNVEQFMNWQILNEMSEFPKVLDKLFLFLPINGTGFKKKFYSKEKERPVDEYISALDMVLPYSTKSLETARRVVHRLWLHYDELQDREEAGIYDKEDFERISKTVTNRFDESKETQKEATGQEPVENKDEPHLILERHSKYDLGDGRKPYIITVDYDSQTLLRMSKRTFKAGSATITLNYFQDYHFIPNPEGYYSFGFGHFLEQLNEMANTAFNQIFDAGKISNIPFGFYQRRLGIKKRKIKLAPGGFYEVEDAKQIYFPSFQKIDNTLFLLLGLIQQYVERFTGATDYLSGRESKGTKTPTATGTVAIIEQGLIGFNMMIKRLFWSFQDELRMQFALNQLYLPESKQYRVMESKDKIAFPEIKKADFDGKFDLTPVGDPTYASTQTRRSEAGQLYQIGMSNPLITGTPPDKETGKALIPPNVPAMHHLWEMVLDSYDRKDKAKLLPELPEPSVKPEEENAMFFQGDYVEPKSGEPHEVHLLIHEGFLNTALYAEMNEDYKQLPLRHIQATKQIAYVDSVQQAQLGGVSTGGNGQPVAPQGEQIQPESVGGNG